MEFTLIHSKLSLMIRDKNMWNHGLLYLKAKWVRDSWNPTLQLYKDCWSFWTYLTVRWLFKMDSETGGTPDVSQIAFGDLIVKKNWAPKPKILTRNMISHIAQKEGMSTLRRICERSSAGSTTCPMGKIWIWWVIPSSGSRFPILSLKWIDRSHTKPGVQGF